MIVTDGLAGEYGTDEVFDVDLLIAFRRGDQVAFTDFYRRYAVTALRYAWSVLGDRVLAEEATQETFLTAWEKRRACRIVDESLLPWLLTICLNKCRNIQRASRKHHAQTIDSIAETAARDPRGDLSALSEALNSLSELDRRVCLLCLVDGYSYAEAARLVDSSETAIGKRLQRARARLQETLQGAE